MADLKISEFTVYTAIAGGDRIVFDNISETGDARNAIITFDNLVLGLATEFGLDTVTTNNLPKVDASDNLVDSIMSDDGTDATVSGGLIVSALSPAITIKDSNSTGTITGTLSWFDQTDAVAATMGFSSGLVDKFFIHNSQDDDIQFYTGNVTTLRMVIKHSGVVNMPGLPTSAAGLSAGDLWNNSNVINIV